MTSSRILELASIITSKTSEIDTYLSTHGLPPLSLDLNEDPQEYTFPDSVQRAQDAVLQATDELHAHMLGPFGILMQETVCLAHFRNSALTLLILKTLCRTAVIV